MSLKICASCAPVQALVVCRGLTFGIAVGFATLKSPVCPMITPPPEVDADTVAVERDTLASILARFVPGRTQYGGQALLLQLGASHASILT